MVAIVDRHLRNYLVRHLHHPVTAPRSIPEFNLINHEGKLYIQVASHLEDIENHEPLDVIECPLSVWFEQLNGFNRELVNVKEAMGEFKASLTRPVPPPRPPALEAVAVAAGGRDKGYVG